MSHNPFDPNGPDRSGELLGTLSQMMASTDYSVEDWTGAMGSLLTILFVRACPTQSAAQNQLRRLRMKMREAIPRIWDEQKQFVTNLLQSRENTNVQHPSGGSSSDPTKLPN